MDLILLFCAGFLQDILYTSAQKSIQRDHIIRAALLSSLIGILNILVISHVIAQMQSGAVWKVLIFAAGKAVGSYISLRILAHIRFQSDQTGES